MLISLLLSIVFASLSFASFGFFIMSFIFVGLKDTRVLFAVLCSVFLLAAAMVYTL